jgi:hypothetical protein|eukprot:scaffold367_cov202-Alexandrium_tamarense.AAC.8
MMMRNEINTPDSFCKHVGEGLLRSVQSKRRASSQGNKERPLSTHATYQTTLSPLSLHEDQNPHKATTTLSNKLGFNETMRFYSSAREYFHGKITVADYSVVLLEEHMKLLISSDKMESTELPAVVSDIQDAATDAKIVLSNGE